MSTFCDTVAGRRLFFERVIKHRGASWNEVVPGLGRNKNPLTPENARTLYRSISRQLLARLESYDQPHALSFGDPRHRFVVFREYFNALKESKKFNKQGLLDIMPTDDSKVFTRLNQRVSAVLQRMQLQRQKKNATPVAEAARELRTPVAGTGATPAPIQTPTSGPARFNSILFDSPSARNSPLPIRPASTQDITALLANAGNIEVELHPRQGTRSGTAQFFRAHDTKPVAKFMLPCSKTKGDVRGLVGVLRKRWHKSSGRADKGSAFDAVISSTALRIFPHMRGTGDDACHFDEDDTTKLADVIIAEGLMTRTGAGGTPSIKLYYELVPEPEVPKVEEAVEAAVLGDVTPVSFTMRPSTRK